jgi:hypothetical protein
MKSKDQILLEQKYEQVILNELNWKPLVAAASMALPFGAKANQVTASDMADSINRDGPSSVGYASKDVRNKATTNQSAVTYEDMVKAGNAFNMTSEESWKEVDKFLEDIYAKAQKDPSSGEKKAIDNLKQIDTKLDSTANNKLNAEVVLKDIYNKVGEATKNTNNGINQQNLFKYIVKEIKNEQNFKPGSIGSFLRTYVIGHTPPKYKEGKLLGNDYWTADKNLRGKIN